MRKSIKKFLIIPQLLGWSALVTSACTDDQAKNTVQNNVSNSSSQDGDKSSKDSSTKSGSTDSNQTQHITKAGTHLTHTLPEGIPPKSDPPPSSDNGKGTMHGNKTMHEEHSEGASGNRVGGMDASHHDQTKDGAGGGAGTPAASSSGTEVKQLPSDGSGSKDQLGGSGSSASGEMGETPSSTEPAKKVS